MSNISLLVPIVFGLMLLVDVFTEVFKNTFYKVIPINLMVLVLSLVITIVAMFIFISIRQIAFVWWMVPIAIVVGFFVAYAAMFGFDKFKQLLDQWNNINKRN